MNWPVHRHATVTGALVAAIWFVSPQAEALMTAETPPDWAYNTFLGADFGIGVDLGDAAAV